MKKVFIIGAFGYDCNQLDGQTIKTRNVYEMVKKRYSGKVSFLDTLLLRKKPWLMITMFIRLIRCNTLILLPCLNNLTYLFPIAYFMSKIFRYEIISICIGGWQVEYFMGTGKFGCHPTIMNLSKKIKAFLPEMHNVDNDLRQKCGFKNTEVFPNFRDFSRNSRTEKVHKGLRLVFMARVNKMKGYDTIFDSLPFIREKCPGTIIDFYGPIAVENKEEFEELVSRNNDIVSYNGLLHPDVIHNTLCDYDVMLLPTKYYTEGFPGSILDAYISGIPVIVTEWKHAHEFVDNGNTGIIIPFEDNQHAFNQAIFQIYENKSMLNDMKTTAYNEANKYSEDAAWQVLNKYL